VFNPETTYLEDEKYVSCYTIFEGFSWEAECWLDQSGKAITMALYNVDCDDYNTDKELVLRANIYGAANDNATVYNERTVINSISQPTGANLPKPVLELLAPITISTCSHEIVYTFFSHGSGKCAPTVTWTLAENP